LLARAAGLYALRHVDRSRCGAPLQLGGDPTRPLNQLLEADLVYVRDVVHPDGISSDQLKHLA
jgi:hypothetical protein